MSDTKFPLCRAAGLKVCTPHDHARLGYIPAAEVEAYLRREHDAMNEAREHAEVEAMRETMKPSDTYGQAGPETVNADGGLE